MASDIASIVLSFKTIFRSRCPRPQTKSNSIEYDISSSQISFLLFPSINKTSFGISPNTNASLITFPPDATLKQILSHENCIHLAAKHSSTPGGNTNEHRCHAHFELQGNILDQNLQFASIDSKEGLILVIDNNIRFKFHQTKRIEPNSTILHEHRKSLSRRLPMNNGLREICDQQSIYPNESLDLLFDTLNGQLTYLTEYLQSHFGERHKFTVYPIQEENNSKSKQWNQWETGIYRMSGDTDGTVNIALAADWDAGTMESALVASSMMNGLDLSVPQERATADLPDYSVHLGDIYYVGLPSEIEHCCLGVKPCWSEFGVRWPIGRNGSFTIPGNHELYSRGFGYWDYFLPHLGLFDSQDLTKPIQSQKTSYWLLENDQWRIIALDTGYNSYSLLFVDNSSIKLPDAIMDWLKNVVGLSPQMTDKRGLIFFSHHQVVSAWNEKPNTEFPEQIASLLPEGRTILYLWGHEHRLSFYEKQTIEPIAGSGKKLTFYGRCVGNAGFPTLATELPTKARETKLKFYDDRLFNIENQHAWTGMALGFNGYVSMKFVSSKNPNDPTLFLTYKSLSLNEEGQLTNENPTILVKEEWTVDSHGNVILNKLQPVNKEITQSLHVEMNDQQSTLTSDKSKCCTTL